MVDFLDEVKEDLKHERLERIFSQYGKHLLAGAVSIVLMTAAITGFMNYRQSSFMETGDEFSHALTLRPEEGVAALEVIAEEGDGGFKIAAAFARGKMLAEQKNWSEAVAAYDAISDDYAMDTALRELAALRAVHILIKTDGDVSVIADRLKHLTEENNPWRASALELQALQAIKLEKYAEAKEILVGLQKDMLVNASLRQRAEILLTILSDRVTNKDGES